MLIDKTPIAWTGRHSDAVPYGNSSIRSIAAQGAITGKPPACGFAALRGIKVRGLLAVLTSIVFLALSGCAAPPDEAALRTRIADLQGAVEARDTDALLEAVDADFGGPGGMDRDGLRRYATLMLLRQQNVGVAIGPVEVALHGDRAAARFDAVVTGSKRFLPEGVEARRVETVWRREGDDWVLVSADWSKPALAR
jgi:ketosteroid isomerase-like protein